ncbi:unnamed protein product, partial [Scytosiphon promiscuus]
ACVFCFLFFFFRTLIWCDPSPGGLLPRPLSPVLIFLLFFSAAPGTTAASTAQVWDCFSFYSGKIYAFTVLYLRSMLGACLPCASPFLFSCFLFLPCLFFASRMLRKVVG